MKQEDKEFHRAYRQGVVSVAGLVLAMLACILIGIMMQGCSPKSQPTIVTETHTTLNTDSLTRLIKAMIRSHNTEKEKETVYVFDKTTYTVDNNGDTVGRERDRVTDRNREWQTEKAMYLHIIDSLRHVKSRADTIDRPVPYPVEKTVEVEKPLAWWQSALIWLGAVALGVAAIALTVWLIKIKSR